MKMESRKVWDMAFSGFGKYTVLKSKGLGKKEAISLGFQLPLREIILFAQIARVVIQRKLDESITKPFSLSLFNW